MRDQEWDAALAKLHSLDLAQLVLSLLGLDAVDGEATLGVENQTEVLASLLDGDDVHEAGGEGGVGADLAVNLDETLHQDALGLTVVEGVLETVAQEDDEGQAFSLLVGTGRRLGSVDTRELVEKPVRGGAKALLVLLTVRPEMLASCRIFSRFSRDRYADGWLRTIFAATTNWQRRKKVLCLPNSRLFDMRLSLTVLYPC